MEGDKEVLFANNQSLRYNIDNIYALEREVFTAIMSAIETVGLSPLPGNSIARLPPLSELDNLDSLFVKPSADLGGLISAGTSSSLAHGSHGGQHGGSSLYRTLPALSVDPARRAGQGPPGQGRADSPFQFGNPPAYPRLGGEFIVLIRVV